MKTLYLHIGMARCGTTSIQNFCTANQKELNRNGYCYPLMPFTYAYANPLRNAHFMYGKVKNKDGIRDTHAEQELTKEGFAQLYKTFQAYDNVILSDEGLWNCGFREDRNAWKRLQEEMLTHNFQTKVIVYLRRQDEYLSSWWGQRIKEGLYFQKTFTWERMLDRMPVVKLDYYQMLEDISLYVGKENLIVRRFDKQYFYNGSLYEDFLNAIDLSYTDAYYIEKEVRNQSLNANNIEIKRIINHITDMTKAEDLAFQKTLVLNSSMSHSQTNYGMFSEEEAKEFYNQYQSGNQKIAIEYLGINTDLFDFEYSASQKWSRNNDEMLNDVVLFMAQETLNLKRQLNDTNALLKQQQNQINYMLNILQHPFKAVGNKLKKKK